MKYIRAIILSFLIHSSLLYGYSEVGVFYDVPGEHTAKSRSQIITDNTEGNFSFYYTQFFKFKNNYLGVGAEYQMMRNYSIRHEGKFQFIPVYGVFRIPVNEDTYLDLKAGYNILKGDDAYLSTHKVKNGAVYGLGLSVNVMRNLVIKASYETNRGMANFNIFGYELDFRIDYSRVRFGLALVL